MSTTPTHPTSSAFPSRIVFEKWADTGFVWQGTVNLSQLPRLHTYIDSADDSTLSLNIRLAKDHNQIVWLSFEVSGTLPLSCHRCLSPMPWDITGSYALAIVTHDSQLPYVEEQEYVLYEELEGDERYLPIGDLLEDELILALPLSLSHDDCTPLITTEETPIIIEEPKENPFAILASLKSTTKS